MKYPSLLLVLLLQSTLFFASDYHYTLQWLAPNTHTYLVSLETQPQTDSYTDFKIPAWRPGRYILQDYAAAISHLEAYGAKGQQLRWTKVDKDTWRVSHEKIDRIRISYRYYANNPDAGSSYLGGDQAYFNPINLFMYVDGRFDDPVRLEVPDLPKDWKVATALQQTASTFSAASYHEFVDSPTVFASNMKQMDFELDGVRFFLHFQGDYQGDAQTDATILENVAKICREQAAIFGGFPFKSYHFIYRLLPYGLRHAVEHKFSSSYALPASVTESPRAAISGICGITSHEFWHVWNVKRIRPAVLMPYNYSQAQYTSLHWFTEGVTDYYTQLTLVRAGIISEKEFLKRLGNTIESLENNYATSVVSPSAASFNSWLASSPYKHPNHQVSYYTLGSRLGMALDLALRSRSKGKVSLDDVFAYLYQVYDQEGLGVSEDGVQAAMEKLSGLSWSTFFEDYVHGTEAIDYETLFAPFGLILEVNKKPNDGAKMLGINGFRNLGQGIVISGLHLEGDAFRSGLSEGDMILMINGEATIHVDLDEYVNNLKKGTSIQMKVFSDQQVKDLIVKYQGKHKARKYSIKTSAKSNELRAVWLRSVVK